MQHELPSGQMLQGTDAQYVKKLEDDLYYSRIYIDYLLGLYKSMWEIAVAAKSKIDGSDQIRKQGLI